MIAAQRRPRIITTQRYDTLSLTRRGVHTQMHGQLQRASQLLRFQIQSKEHLRRRTKRRRGLTPPTDFTSFRPEHAEFWTSLSFSEFIPHLGVALHANPSLELDRAAWTAHSADGFTIKQLDIEDLEAQESQVIATGSPFGRRLAVLLHDHADWPLVAGNLNCREWLHTLAEDSQPQAADVYFAISRGIALLPPELAASFPTQQIPNYGSALENMEAVDAELERLLSKHILRSWESVKLELGLPLDATPRMVLALGVVLRNGKTRLIIDGSAGDPSINSLQEVPPTVLPSIFMSMAAMTASGWAWKSDYTDAFCQHVLARSSLPICVIEWRGQLWAFDRLGFGFRGGPSAQQSTTISVVRALTRTLTAAGLHGAPPPSMDHSYLPTQAAPTGSHWVNANLAFLDDIGSFNGSRASAWFGFAHYLMLCHRLSLVISFKEGKTVSPTQLLHYLGFNCDHVAGTISLDANRVSDLLAKLTAFRNANTMTVGEALSLVGVLVFCSTVIRVGRTHYRALIDAITSLGPDPPKGRRLTINQAMQDGIDMWCTLLGLLNTRPISAPISRHRVPGEVTSDASFDGWGWEGMGDFAFGQWPTDWTDRIGRPPPGCSDAHRIWICELELWAVLFLCRQLCPRCVHCVLIVRVDNLPVCRMLDKLSTRSAACLPLLRELAWLLATFDVELDVRWIDTVSNELSDVLSRRFSSDHEPIEFTNVVSRLSDRGADPEWLLWPAAPPARPELLAHIPVAHPADFSTAWASLDLEELARLLPFYLQ